MQKLQPPFKLQKGHPLFPTNPPLKIKVQSSPPFWKLGRRFLPPAEIGGGAGVHTMSIETFPIVSFFTLPFFCYLYYFINDGY